MVVVEPNGRNVRISAGISHRSDASAASMVTANNPPKYAVGRNRENKSIEKPHVITMVVNKHARPTL